MTNGIVDLVEEAQLDGVKRHIALEEIVNAFEPKIIHSLNQTSWQEREDLKQELILNIIIIVDSYDIDKNISIFDYISL
jgi:hypothetical protein